MVGKHEIVLKTDRSDSSRELTSCVLVTKTLTTKSAIVENAAFLIISKILINKTQKIQEIKNT